MKKFTQWKKVVGMSLALIIGFQVLGLNQWLSVVPTTQAAFYNTGFINLLNGSKSLGSEATTIDNLFPLTVSGGNIRTYDPSFSGYNRSNDTRGVSSITAPINLTINLPIGQYDIDVMARYGNQNGTEINENLVVRAGNTTFNIPDQGDSAIFDIYHFSGFNLTSAVTSIQIAGTGEGEVEFGGFRIVGQSSTVSTRPVLSSCTVTTTPTVARANQAATFNVTPNGGSAPFTYAFDFNSDGAFDTTTLTNNAQYTYATPGHYLVGIRVTDTAGGYVRCDHTLTVDQGTVSTPTATASPTSSTTATPTSTPTATATPTTTPTPTMSSTPTNHAPVCTGITASTTSPREGTVVTFQAQASDPDRDDHLSYSYNFGDGMTRGISTQAQAAHDYIAAGNYTITAQVQDHLGLTANCPSLNITVSRFTTSTPSSTPTVTVTPTVTASATPTVTTTPTATTSATPTITSTPTTTASPTPTNTVTPTVSAQPTHTHTSTPTSSTTPRATPTTIPTVSANLAPSCILSTDNTSPYTGVIVTFTIFASDPEDQTMTYAIDFGDGNGYISTGFVSSRSYTTVGNHTVRARVSDGTNLSNCNNIDLTVRSNNRAPSCTLAISPRNPTTNDTVTLTVNATDPDNDTLVYSYIFGDGNNQDTASTTTTHRYTVAGTYPIQASARDSGGLIGQCFASGTVNPVTNLVVVQNPTTPIPTSNPTNHAPVCTFNLSTTTSTTATDIVFTITSSDPDNDTLTYIYNFGDGNSRSIATNTTTYRYTVAGSFIATTSVRDSRGLSTNCPNTNTGAVTPSGSTTNTNITVVITTPGTPATNHAPVCSFVVSNVHISPNSDVVFTVSASDADNDTLTYTYNFGDGNSRDLAGNMTTYRYTTVGNFTASVTVRDNHGISTTCTNTNTGVTTPTTNPSNPTVTTITISITPLSPTNQAPICQNLNIAPGTTLTVNTDMILTITGRDPENSQLTYTVRFNDGTTNSVGTSNIVHHTYANPGSYILRTSISDGSLSTNCAEVTFTINAAPPTTASPSANPTTNQAPVCTAIRLPTTAVAGSPVGIAIDASDPDHQALMYLINFGDNTNQNSSISPVYHTYSGSGSYTITAQVRDTANVTVNCPNAILAVNPVPNTAPLCLTTEITPNPVTANATVSFRVTGSDADGDLLTYTYFFGDGESTSNITGTSTHAYHNNGVYISQIQINDGRGGITNCANNEVRVQAPNTSGQVCQALRLVTPNPTATVEFTVEFVPTHPENGPFWGVVNFNNGYTSQGFNVLQRTGFYSIPGTYRIDSALQDRFGNRTNCPDLYVTIR